MDKSSLSLYSVYTEWNLEKLPYIKFMVNDEIIWEDDDIATANPEPIVKSYILTHPDFMVTNVEIEVVQYHHCVIKISGYTKE